MSMDQLMLPAAYRTVVGVGCAEIVEKKSRFIAHIAPAESEAAAQEYIAGMRKEYWDARHNCHAFCVGLSPEMTRCSDDGEPAQTAGKPMLDVLMGAGLKNTVAVVTRYFGGTLLGTGGLVRAYSAAVREGIAASRIIEKKLCTRIQTRIDYTLLGKMQNLLAGSQIMTVDTAYEQNVVLDLLVPRDDLPWLEKQTAEISGGSILLEEQGICYGAVSGSEVLVFPV